MRRLGLFLFLLILGCGIFRSEVRELTEEERKLSNASLNFAFDIFKELSTLRPDSNLIISPFSIHLALSMTWNGSSGTTDSAMREVLFIKEMTRDELLNAYSGLMELLSGIDDEVISKIANSIWYHEDFPVKDSFVNESKEYFDAEIHPIDFYSPDAPALINEWVKEKTYGKIEEIIERIPPLVVMYLINAIYFQGTWKYEFDEEKTQPDTFYLDEENYILCDMMEGDGVFRWLFKDEFSSVELPYGNGYFRMVIFLPEDINSFISQLTPENWNEYLSESFEDSGRVRMPKFEIQYKDSLRNVLEQMGMGIAFSLYYANFSRMSDETLYISRVLHKTYVKVDEKGTEAAAVTAVGMGLTEINGSDSHPFIEIKRPFVFVIYEKHTQTIWFIGRIVKPN